MKQAATSPIFLRLYDMSFSLGSAEQRLNAGQAIIVPAGPCTVAPAHVAAFRIVVAGDSGVACGIAAVLPLLRQRARRDYTRIAPFWCFRVAYPLPQYPGIALV